MTSPAPVYTGMKSETLVVAIVIPAIALVIVLSLVLLHKRGSLLYSSTHNATAAAKTARAKTRLSVLDHRLKTQRYCEWAGVEMSGKTDEEMALCTICLDPFTPDAQIRGLECAHAFHAECLDEWYARFHEWCPLCHRAIVPGTKTEVSKESSRGVYVSGGFLV